MSSGANFQALAPLIALGLGAILLMLQLSIRRSMGAAYAITVGTFLLAAASTRYALAVAPLQVTALLRADDFALFFSLLFCLGGLVTAIISQEYLARREGENEEYFLLLILSTLGAVTLVHAAHLASLLLGLELLGVALYALIGYPDRGTHSLEAAIKYLVLSGAASAVFLFGFALLYAATGVLGFDEIGSAALSATARSQTLITAGAAMIIAGLGFKLSVVPFHMWTPDVYEGAPAPVSGFLAAISKAAVFAAILRWWLASNLQQFESLLLVVTVLAGASMLVGNLLALLQDNVKRLLAYSSIAHVGYLLIVLVACGEAADPGLAVEAACYYLVAYTSTTLAAFTLLGLISRRSGDRDCDQLGDLSGLYWREPGLALLFSVSLFSLAGIPLTAGFIGKFYLFASGVDAGLWTLLSLLVIGSAIGIYYYLRIVYTMTRSDRPGVTEAAGTISVPSRLTFYALVVAMLYLGIVPESLMHYLRTIL